MEQETAPACLTETASRERPTKFVSATNQQINHRAAAEFPISQDISRYNRTLTYYYHRKTAASVSSSLQAPLSIMNAR